MCESVGKVDLLSDHFHSMQSRESVDLPLNCHPSPRLTTFAVWSSEVRRLLLDLVETAIHWVLSFFSQENC